MDENALSSFLTERLFPAEADSNFSFLRGFEYCLNVRAPLRQSPFDVSRVRSSIPIVWANFLWDQ